MVRLTVTGVHINVDDKLQKYVAKKIGGLEKYIARRVRESAQVEVRLKEGKAKDNNKSTCEVVVRLPQEAVTVSESTVNMYAAIDIAEEKLKHALRKYKETHDGARAYRRVIGRLARRNTIRE